MIHVMLWCYLLRNCCSCLQDGLYLLFTIISVTVQNRTHVHMNFFAWNHTYYHFPKYCRFLLNHPVFSFPLLIFIPLGTFCIICITFCNAKLNSIADKESPYFSPVLFSKKEDNVPSILTALLIFRTHVLHIFINFVGILNSSIHFHKVWLCIESYAFWKSINKYCTLCLYSQIFSFNIFSANMLSITDLYTGCPTS